MMMGQSTRIHHLSGSQMFSAGAALTHDWFGFIPVFAENWSNDDVWSRLQWGVGLRLCVINTLGEANCAVNATHDVTPLSYLHGQVITLLFFCAM